MADMMQFAMNLLKANPKVANSPMGKEFMDILQNNDSARGEQMANNLLGSMNMTREEALQQAQNTFFNQGN